MGKAKSFETQQVRLSLITSVPIFLLLIAVMVYAEISTWLVLLTLIIGSIVIGYANYRINQDIVYKFRTLNNLLTAMIEEDFSLRVPSDQNDGALDELVESINGLAQRLSLQRSESIENQLLLRIVIDHIVVAIVALTENNQVIFSNPAAKRLHFPDSGELSPELMEQLHLMQGVAKSYKEVVELSLGNVQGRFHVLVEEFRESGIKHKLFFITDVDMLLRLEERKAWQRLVRVISHEINNSLSPISSISQTLLRLIARSKRDDELDNSLFDGLTIIAERAEGLRLFVESYGQLAKLPEPNIKKTSIKNLLEKVCFLFKEQKIFIHDSTDLQLKIDSIQFEQVLINLIKNAVESTEQNNPDGVITIQYGKTGNLFKLLILDEGGGISNPDNLFVPFYSTKKNGSGIGLVLCRQIIEAHGGHLMVLNRPDRPGVCASIELP